MASPLKRRRPRANFLSNPATSMGRKKRLRRRPGPLREAGDSASMVESQGQNLTTPSCLVSQVTALGVLFWAAQVESTK